MIFEVQVVKYRDRYQSGVFMLIRVMDKGQLAYHDRSTASMAKVQQNFSPISSEVYMISLIFK